MKLIHRTAYHKQLMGFEIGLVVAEGPKPDNVYEPASGRGTVQISGDGKLDPANERA